MATTGFEIPADLSPLLDVARVHAWADDADESTRRWLGIYLAEAAFFHRVLAPDLDRLRPGSNVLEIGSGIGLLSRLIAQRGHRVVAFEPAAAGFGDMHTYSQLLDECWLPAPVGDIALHAAPFHASSIPDARFDLCFAINVIEHVPEPSAMVAEATSLLQPGGHGRFICPNYLIPYEPHFGFPTLVSKRLTGKVLRRRIEQSSLPDSVQFWDDLAWPTHHSMHRGLRSSGVDHSFSRTTLLAYADRLRDPVFLERKGSFFKLLAGSARPLFDLTARHIPATIGPVLDITTRPSGASGL